MRGYSLFVFKFQWHLLGSDFSRVFINRENTFELVGSVLKLPQYVEAFLMQ